MFAASIDPVAPQLPQPFTFRAATCASMALDASGTSNIVVVAGDGSVMMLLLDHWAPRRRHRNRLDVIGPPPAVGCTHTAVIFSDSVDVSVGAAGAPGGASRAAISACRPPRTLLSSSRSSASSSRAASAGQRGLRDGSPVNEPIAVSWSSTISHNTIKPSGGTGLTAAADEAALSPRSNVISAPSSKRSGCTISFPSRNSPTSSRAYAAATVSHANCPEGGRATPATSIALGVRIRIRCPIHHASPGVTVDAERSGIRPSMQPFATTSAMLLISDWAPSWFTFHSSGTRKIPAADGLLSIFTSIVA